MIDQNLVGNEPLQKIITLCMQSSYVKNNEHPVSLLILSEAEHGKTVSMSHKINDLIKDKRVFFSNNITAKYIEKNLMNDIKKGNMRHIIIPDLINAIERGKNTRKLFINFMKSLIEEGIMHVADAYSQFESDIPVKCGVITGITKGIFNDNRHEWKNIGFISRLVPFSYSYDSTKISQIMDSIFNYREFKKKKDLPLILVDTEIKDADQVAYTELKVMSMTYGSQVEAIGIRMFKNLVGLARANALMNGRKKVGKEDIAEIIRLSKWINFNYNVL